MAKEIEQSEAMKLFRKFKTDKEKGKLVDVLYEQRHSIEKNSLSRLINFMESEKFYLCAGKLSEKLKNYERAKRNYKMVGAYDLIEECIKKQSEL